MTDKIKKALDRLSGKEKEQVQEILLRLINGDTKGLMLLKLKGSKDVYRVRKGKIRIIFRKQANSIKVLLIERRSEDTYKNIK